MSTWLKFNLLTHMAMPSTGGSVVEFSPATREARVRFPASALFFLFPFLCFFFCFKRICEFVTCCTTNIFENLICLQYKKGSIPLFQKLFLGILQKGKFFRWPFSAYPNPFFWKEGNYEVVVMHKEKNIYILLHSLSRIYPKTRFDGEKLWNLE